MFQDIILRKTRFLICLIVSCLASGTASASTLFYDDFSTFSLGTNWEAASAAGATGAPDVTLSTDGDLLTMVSGFDNDDFRGIQTIGSFPTAGRTSFVLDARIMPASLGASDSSRMIEVMLFGSSGAWISASASGNTAGGPDWSDGYADSAGNSASTGSFTHCAFGCSSIRRFILSVDENGVELEVRNANESLHGFNPSFANLVLSDFGSSMTVVLRQLKVQGGYNAAGGFVDEVTLSAFPALPAPEPSTFILATLGIMSLGLRWRRRR